jgi:hypothetical protein
LPSGDTATVPVAGMAVIAWTTWKVVFVTVSGSICLLNCTWITAFVGTPEAASTGLALATVGAIRSAPLAVVKLDVTGAASAFPVRS